MPDSSKGAEYMRRRRAEGKAWDQRPENRERVRKRQREYWHRPRAAGSSAASGISRLNAVGLSAT